MERVLGGVGRKDTGMEGVLGGVSRADGVSGLDSIWRLRRIYIYIGGYTVFMYFYEGYAVGGYAMFTFLLEVHPYSYFYWRLRHIIYNRPIIAQVTDGGSPISRLNELEYVGDELWANVYTTNTIARIDPQSGAVCT